MRIFHCFLSIFAKALCVPEKIRYGSESGLAFEMVPTGIGQSQCRDGSSLPNSYKQTWSRCVNSKHCFFGCLLFPLVYGTWSRNSKAEETRSLRLL